MNKTGLSIMDNTAVFYTANMGSIPVGQAIIFFLVMLFALPAFAKKKAEPMPPAKAVLVFNRASNTITEELNIHEPMPIASITKLMTVYVVLESKEDLNEKLVVIPQQIEGSRTLRKGMVITRQELITLSLIASDNLAAKLLAVNYHAGYNSFIRQMNDTAVKLGMTNTNYIESSGLLKNTSTAWDLHLLNQALLKYPVFRDAAMSKTAVADAQNKKGIWQRLMIRNTNAFAGEYDIKVGKTGFTNPAGWCIDMRIQYKAQDFDIIVLGSPDKKTRNKLVESKLKEHMNFITTHAIVNTIEDFDNFTLNSGLRSQ